MLADYIPIYRRSLDRASAQVAEVAEELEEARSTERRAEANVVDARRCQPIRLSAVQGFLTRCDCFLDTYLKRS